MNLQTILFGQFTPPLGGKVRRHTILQDGNKPMKSYEPRVERPTQQQYLIDQLTKLVNQHPGICTNELSEMVGKAKSYMYRMLILMREEGMVKAVRGKPPRRGGPTTTLFYPKD